MFDRVQDGDAFVANTTDDPRIGNLSSEYNTYYNTDYDDSSSYFSSFPGGYLPMTSDLDWVPHTLFSIVFIVGIPGNALVIFVLLRNGALRITTNIYLFNLAVVDFFFLVCEVPAKIGVYFVSPGDMSWKLGLGMCKFSIYLVYVNMAVSIITLTALAVNRYCAVMHPISTRTHRSMSQTMVIICSIWVIAIGSQVPMLMVGDLYYPSPYSACIEIWPNMSSMKAFKTSLFVFFYIIPLTVITVCYIRMASMLWHSSDFGHASTATQASAVGVRRHQSRRKIARLVLVLVAGFAFCWFPWHLRNQQEMYMRESLPGNLGVYYYGVIVRVLCYTNSCINPLLYSFLGENFRAYLKKAFLCQNPFRLKRRILAPLELRFNGVIPIYENGVGTIVTASSRMSTMRKSASSF